MNCTPYLLLVKVTAKAQMSAKILSVAQFLEMRRLRVVFVVFVVL